EAKTNQNSGCDRDWRAKPSSALEKSPECESNQNQLQPPVLGDSDQTTLQNFESSGCAGELIQEDDVENDPANRQESVTRPVSGGHEGHLGRHAKYSDRNQQ